MPSEDETKKRSGLIPRGPASHARRILVVWSGGLITRDLPAVGALTFGRHESCDVRIDDASVSRRHAILHVGPRIELEDLGSSNGSRVSGRSVPPRGRVEIEDGAYFTLGDVRVLVESARAADAPVDAHEAEELGESMTRVRELLDLVAPSPLSVILRGETGVGKDLAATMLHARSRRSGPFVRVNCAAIPEMLLESELFGHERGAFTGAVRAKPGLLETADGGTAFLDEIAELPLSSQAKLLQVIESREVLRVGAVSARKTDVRIVCATHRDLAQLVHEGRFRQDLYFRLNGVTIEIPPLRARRHEILELARAFASAAATAMRAAPPTIGDRARAVLEGYAYPGNIRELKNAVERAVVLAGGAVIEPKHLPPEMTGAAASRSAPPPPPVSERLADELASIERERIVEALARAGGHQGRAAETLGISRRTLLSRLDAHGLPRPRKNQDPAKR